MKTTAYFFPVTRNVVECSDILICSASSAEIFMYSATDETSFEYQTVAVTVTGPGAVLSGRSNS